MLILSCCCSLCITRQIFIFKCLCTKHVDSDFDHFVPGRTFSVDDVTATVVQFALRDHDDRGCVSGVDLRKQNFLCLEVDSDEELSTSLKVLVMIYFRLTSESTGSL